MLLHHPPPLSNPSPLYPLTLSFFSPLSPCPLTCLFPYPPLVSPCPSHMSLSMSPYCLSLSFSPFSISHCIPHPSHLPLSISPPLSFPLYLYPSTWSSSLTLFLPSLPPLHTPRTSLKYKYFVGQVPMFVICTILDTRIELANMLVNDQDIFLRLLKLLKK